MKRAFYRSKAAATSETSERPAGRIAAVRKTATGIKTGTILAPTDFSPESLRALEYASLLLGFLGGELHLLFVHDRYGLLDPRRKSAELDDEISDFYEGRLKELAANCAPRAPARCEVRIGRAFDEICRLADEISAQLIVISTHGRTGLKRMLLGSTTERVVRHTRCPVLVVRERERVLTDLAKPQLEQTTAHKMKILVPVDFSDCSRQGLDYAIAFARAWNAELVLLHTVEIQAFIEPGHYAQYNSMASLEVVERAAKAQMRELTRQTNFRRVPYTTDIQMGNPAYRICEYADDHRIDLIITSTHGTTGFAHVLVGSVAEHVVRSAHCPVLVVPRGTTATPSAAGVHRGARKAISRRTKLAAKEGLLER